MGSALSREECERRLRAISEQFMERRDGLRGLYELRSFLNSLDLLVMSGRESPELITFLWVLKQFMGELWKNFGGDASGFPEREKSTLIDISQSLGAMIFRFLKNGVINVGQLSKAVENYYRLLRETELSITTAELQKRIIF